MKIAVISVILVLYLGFAFAFYQKKFAAIWQNILNDYFFWLIKYKKSL